MLDSQTISNISKLRLYLVNLPSSIPHADAAQSVYKFHDFAPDQEWVDDVGLEGAINRELEIRLGSRGNGSLTFRERGIGLNPLADVLKSALERYPSSVLLLKWLDDLLEASKTAYTVAGIAVSA